MDISKSCLYEHTWWNIDLDKHLLDKYFYYLNTLSADLMKKELLWIIDHHNYDYYHNTLLFQITARIIDENNTPAPSITGNIS